MKENELVIDRQDHIELFYKTMLTHADGENIIGDGENLITDCDAAKITHDFVDGIYVRRMDMKKDCIVIGAIHHHLHVWFLMSGHVTIANKEGVEDYISPCIVTSGPGTQRIIQANEDSIFVTVHQNPTNTKDLDKIENEFCSIDMNKYKEYLKNKK